MLRLLKNPRNQAFCVIVCAVLVWLVYVFITPGGEFFVCYRLLVIEPEKLVDVFGYPLTYNPPWLAPILAPLITMPGRSGFILFLALTVALIVRSAFVLNNRVLSIKTILLLLSSQLFWILWWGQIEALVMLGFALGWSSFQNKNWKWMLVALLLVALKPQIGLLPILYLWWGIGRDRWKTLAGFLLVLVISMVIYGPWPIWFLENVVKISQATHYKSWNASFGLVALPLLLPALFIPLNAYQRMIALTATGLLISPYMPFYSTIPLLAFALPGWSVIFAFLGYFSTILGTTIAWNGMALFPVCVLLWLYLPRLRLLPWIKRWDIFQRGPSTERVGEG